MTRFQRSCNGGGADVTTVEHEMLHVWDEVIASPYLCPSASVTSIRTTRFSSDLPLLVPLQKARIQLNLLLKLTPPVLKRFQGHSLAPKASKKVERIANDPLREYFRSSTTSGARVQPDHSGTRLRLLRLRILERGELLLHLRCWFDGYADYDFATAYRWRTSGSSGRVIGHHISICIVTGTLLDAGDFKNGTLLAWTYTTQ